MQISKEQLVSKTTPKHRPPLYHWKNLYFIRCLHKNILLLYWRVVVLRVKIPSFCPGICLGKCPGKYPCNAFFLWARPKFRVWLSQPSNYCCIRYSFLPWHNYMPQHMSRNLPVLLSGINATQSKTPRGIKGVVRLGALCVHRYSVYRIACNFRMVEILVFF